MIIMEQSAACSVNLILGLKERCWVVSERGVSSFELTLARAIGSEEKDTESRNCQVSPCCQQAKIVYMKPVPRETFGQQRSILSWLWTKGVSVLLKPLLCSG